MKAPKFFFRDSGLLHHLLGIHTLLELENHPKSGASWEGYAVEEILAAVEPDEAYFWGTHAGGELDLLLVKDGRRKASSANASMRRSSPHPSRPP